MHLIEIPSLEVENKQVVDLLKLMNPTWPNEDTMKSVEETVAEFYGDHPEKICYCLYEGKGLIGYAESIPLTIKTENTWMEALEDYTLTQIGEGKDMDDQLYRPSSPRSTIMSILFVCFKQEYLIFTKSLAAK